MVRRIICLFSVLLLWASFAVCQKNGVATFSAADSFEFDSVNLTNLVPSFNIPILMKGVGPLPGSVVLLSPQSCKQIPEGTMFETSCGPGGIAGLYFFPHELYYMTANYTTTTAMNCSTNNVTGLLGGDTFSFYPLTQTQLISCNNAVVTKTVTTIDGSGITVTLSATGPIVSVLNPTTTSGWTTSSTTSTTLDDAFSNTTTYTNTGTFTDSLGAVTTGLGFDPSSIGYTDTNGTAQTVTLGLGTQTTFEPRGDCGTFANGTNVTPITSITFPDSTKYSLGWDTNNGGISGLINSITLRTGGQISYTYGTTTDCLSPGWGFNTLKRTTPDGDINYTLSISSGVTTTTVLDPGKNKTVYTFSGTGLTPNNGFATFLQSVARYQNTGSVASPAYTEISSADYCYNTSTHPCTNTPAYPITQRDIYAYTYTPSGTQVQMSHDRQTYDSTYGLLLTDAATDSINSQTITTTYVYGTDSSGTCVAITNTAVVDHPCTITTKNGSTWLSGSTYSYNSNGALTSSSACLSSTCTGSSALATTYTPTTQGTYSAIQDPNGQTTNYTYGSCNSLTPTDVTTTVNSIAIDNKATWNCNGGLVVDTTDANSNEDDYVYDSMNRLSSYTDNLGNVTSYAYGTPTMDHTKVTDPLNVVSYTYVDGLGRPVVNQICQTTGCSTLDTVSMTYGWKDSGNNALTNFQTTTSADCATTSLDATCSTVAVTALTNPIAGPYKTTDVNSGTGTYAVNSKDFSFTAGPAPSDENTKVVQTEVDGFGRITSRCALESSGGTSCGQTMGNSGILTSNVYSFDATTGAPKVVTTRGSQTHTTIADNLGRPTSIKIPETGSTARSFSYDSQSTQDNCTSSGGRTSKGDMLRNNLPDGTNYICYDYDGLHRMTDVGNSIINATHPCKRFRYDSTANNAYTAPTSYPSSGANLLGRLMEASTDDCTFPLSQTHMLTDEWFAYDKNGRMTDMWETTPNSGGFYHTTVTYDADDNLTEITGIPSASTYYFAYDGEGRPYNSKKDTTWIVGSSSTTGVTYDNASRPLTVPLSTSTTNSDAFLYDNMGNMTKYTFTSGSTTMVGQLTWSPIGSLRELNITDGFNSGGTQDCKFGTSTVIGYDDVGRLLDANCGSTIFHNSFAYDQYDNLTQTGSISWNPGYSSTNNQMTGSSYDTNGNVTYDGTNTYATNVYGKLVNVRSGSSGAVCGTSGTCITNDAFDRVAELNNAGTYMQILYGPVGRIGQMNGQTPISQYIPQPGGGAIWVSDKTYFLHPDWLGTKRLGTVYSTGAQLFDTAFAPYGQYYDHFGNLTPQDFAGILGNDVDAGQLFDTPNRSLSSAAGRFVQIDPAHSGWNAYAYPTDPNTQTDPSGLESKEKYAPATNCPFWCWLRKFFHGSPPPTLIDNGGFTLFSGQGPDRLSANAKPPYIPRGRQPYTKVNVMISDSYTTDAAAAIMESLQRWTAINHVAYVQGFFNEDLGPNLSPNHPAYNQVPRYEPAGVWGNGGYDYLWVESPRPLRKGMTAQTKLTGWYEEAQPEGEWLHQSIVTPQPGLSMWGLYDQIGYEELHNNFIGDCPNCAGFLNMHYSVRGHSFMDKTAIDTYHEFLKKFQDENGR